MVTPDLYKCKHLRKFHELFSVILNFFNTLTLAFPIVIVFKRFECTINITHQYCDDYKQSK